MEQVSKTTLPPGFGYSWTGTALQEKVAGGQTTDDPRAAVLFAYLVLVGLYESWAMPAAVMVSIIVDWLARSLDCGFPAWPTTSSRRSASSC